MKNFYQNINLFLHGVKDVIFSINAEIVIVIGIAIILGVVLSKLLPKKESTSYLTYVFILKVLISLIIVTLIFQVPMMSPESIVSTLESSPGAIFILISFCVYILNINTDALISEKKIIQKTKEIIKKLWYESLRYIWGFPLSFKNYIW